MVECVDQARPPGSCQSTPMFDTIARHVVWAVQASEVGEGIMNRDGSSL